MYSQFEVRQSFLNFFIKKGHQVYPSASLIPAVSTGLLFTNAGMNPFKDIFCGVEIPPNPPRVVNFQKCMRISGKHNDLEEVGIDTSHHTFFEMLGNWSFGDYKKQEAILWAWELLTQVWKIPPQKLFVTYYHEDEETAMIWRKEIGLSAERVLPFGKRDNFWEMGDAGPCGPCTEIHIFDGEGDPDVSLACDPQKGVNSGSATFLEIWNLVFIQSLRQRDGSLVPLPKFYVDTGMGLERIVRILQGKHSNYDTDIFTPILSKICQISGRDYQGENQIPMRVIADHIRAICFAVADGIPPSNEGRGYVIRRILRRAFRYGKQLEIDGPFLHLIVSSVANLMGPVYPRLIQEEQAIKTWILQEETLFDVTLSRGLEYFSKWSSPCQSSGEKIFSGKDAFTLYDTYGFPIDLTGVLCQEKGLQVDEIGFETCMQEQKNQSAAARIQKKISIGESHLDTPQTKFLGEEQESVETTLLWMEEGCSQRVILQKEYTLVFEQTVLYAEGGGQVSDTGTAVWMCACSQKTQFVVRDVQKKEGIFFHIGMFHQICSVHFVRGERVVLRYDHMRRRALVRNHTATHLLQQALRDVLGSQVKQSGSLVDVDRLRFDFTFPKTPSEEELFQVENLVNQQIEKNAPVVVTHTTLEEAKTMGALAFFEDRYGKQVRVVNMGNYSIELCGGTHAHFLGEVGIFVIDGVRSIASGVKRIEAKTGPKVLEEFQFYRRERRSIAKTLRISDQLIEAELKTLVFDHEICKDSLSIVHQILETQQSLTPFVQRAPWQHSSQMMQHFFVSFFPSGIAIQKAVSLFGIPLTKKELSSWASLPIRPRVIASGKVSSLVDLQSSSLSEKDVIHICWNVCPQENRFDFLFVNKMSDSEVATQWLEVDPQSIAKRVAGKFKARCDLSHSLFCITELQVNPAKDFSGQVLSEFWKAVEQTIGAILYYDETAHEKK